MAVLARRLALALTLVLAVTGATFAQKYDADDGSVPGGKVGTSQVIGESYLWNGSVWVRVTGDSTNGIKIQCMAGCSSTAVADGSTYAASTTAGTPMMGARDDAGTTAIAEDKVGIARMSSRRELFFQIRDAAGNERGANVNGSGELLVAISSIPSHAVTNAGTFAVQADTELPAAAALADATANPTVPAVSGYNMCWNGATWDRCAASDGGAGVSSSNTTRVIVASNQPPISGTLKSGTITSAMTATTSTQVIAAQASNYLYITSCSLSNDHASVSTNMSLQDGSGGTVLWKGLVPFGGGREVVFAPAPLKVPTLGNGLYVVNVTTGSSTYASCSGYYTTVSF